MSERHGVEIDYCPQCRGVWLDRGELDKILDRVEDGQPSGQTSAPSYSQAPQGYSQPVQSYSHDVRRDHNYDRRSSDHTYPGDSHYKKKRKESFLGDIFDF